MANGNRDANFIVVGMGVSSEDGLTPVPITVDPVTGRLRCKNQSQSGENCNPDGNPPNRDGNRISAGAGLNQSLGKAVPLSSKDGALMVQIS